MAIEMNTLLVNFSVMLNMMFIWWFFIYRGLLHPFTVIIIKNRGKENKFTKKIGKLETKVTRDDLEKELAKAKAIAKDMASSKMSVLSKNYVQLDNYEIILTKARLKYKNGIKGFAFLRQKGFVPVSTSMRLYPVRNVMKQEVAAILYTEDEENYQYVGIRKDGDLKTLPEDLKAWAVEALKQNAKKWESNKTLQLLVNSMPIITMVMLGLGAFIFMKQLLPDMITQASQASAIHIEQIKQGIAESGIKCVCECPK